MPLISAVSYVLHNVKIYDSAALMHKIKELCPLFCTSDSMPHSLASTELEDPYGKGASVHLEPQSDSAHDQPQRTHLGPPGSQRGSKALNSEDRIRRLEELVDGLSTMLDMVKAQVCIALWETISIWTIRPFGHWLISFLLALYSSTLVFFKKQ